MLRRFAPLLFAAVLAAGEAGDGGVVVDRAVRFVNDRVITIGDIRTRNGIRVELFRRAGRVLPDSRDGLLRFNRDTLEELTDEELLQLTSVAQALGYSGAHDEMDRPLSPRGYRMLERIPRLPSSVVEKLVKNFKTMHNIMQASEKMLDEVEGVGKVRARAIKEGLRRIAESSLVERYI